MSNGLAIAAVTAVLKNVLEDGLVQNSALSSIGNVLLTTLPPDKVSIGADGQPQLNLFLYQVTQNRNADWMGRDRNHQSQLRGKAINDGNANLAINLHYLLTAYGSKDFQTEILLGSAMELMHQNPVLSNDKICEALKHTATINRAGLFAQAMESTSLPVLTEQLDQVQITPNLFDTEKMSRLWSLLQSSYRPSIAYEISMVFIGDRKSSRGTNPSSKALDCPYIEKVVASPATGGAIIAGSSLIVYGRSLGGEVTRIRLNGGKTLLEPEIVEEHRILFTLPKNLQAGVQQIQIVHQPLYKLQNSQELESNERTFVLHPIIATSCEGQDGITQSQNDRAESEGTTLIVDFKPKVGPQQQVIFKLTSANEQGGEDYRFEAPSRDSDTSVIRLPIDAAVTGGKYCVHVEVDGAENLTGMNQTGNVIHVIERSEPCDNPLQTE
jgi:hypothetical protein